MSRTRRALVGAILAAIVLAIIPATSSPASASTRRCEDTRHGRVCAYLHTPPKGSHTAAESVRFKSYRYLPMDSLTTVTYLGYARRDLENGRDVWTVRGRYNRAIWHTYRIVLRAACNPATFDTAAVATSDSVAYPEYAPTCRGYRWELKAGDLPEDAYGWNCWIDGNRECGPNMPTADQCVTMPSDGYTMCRDGRVYLLRGLSHVAELHRITP